jgi:hypothetical protein
MIHFSYRFRCNCFRLAMLTALGLLAGPVTRALAQAPPVYVSPYWGYTYDPYGGYLHGTADIIRSQGDYMKSLQEADLTKQHVRDAKLETRRKFVEQWLWERANLPTWQDERERVQREELRRSRNDPPPTEIWSGGALNILLDDAKKITSIGQESGSPPLDPELLSKINVTTGKRDANIGLIRSGKLTWPLFLRRRAFKNDREYLDQLVVRALEEAAQNKMDADAIPEMMEVINRLEKELKGLVRAQKDDDVWTPTLFIDAKGFLNQLRDSVKVLMQPDVAQYLGGRYRAKGKDVAELVKYMGENGLHFAAATPGSEAAYSALHHLLSLYDSQAGSRPELQGARPK